MYCHIHRCHYHHCNCVAIDSKETGRALTQEELLAYTQEMKGELKDYTVDLKDQIFSYIDIGVNPVEIANSINSLKEQDTYILRTLTNKIDELNNTTNLSTFNLRTRVTDLEGQSSTIIQDLTKLENNLSSLPFEDGVLDGTIIVDGNQSQKQINLFGGKKYDMPIGGYPLGAVVLLDNGDLVKSVVTDNTYNPNTDMTGWSFVGNKSVFDGRNVYQIAGALRNSGTGWEFISDSFHAPINVSSVVVENNIDLKVSFASAGVKVISGVVTCDESYSRLGLQVGASVGINHLTIRGYLPLEFSVTTNGVDAPLIDAIPEVKNRITASRSGFKIRVNHTGAINDYPQVTPISGSPSAFPVDVTPTAINILQEFTGSPYYYRIQHNGTDWALQSNNTGSTIDSSKFASTGELIVNLGIALTGNDFNLRSTSDRYKESISKITSFGLNTFTVKFVNPVSNEFLTNVSDAQTIDSSIQYGASKSSSNNNTTLPAGTYNVSRGLIPVYWDEIKSPDSYGGNANLWFTAIIEY